MEVILNNQPSIEIGFETKKGSFSGEGTYPEMVVGRAIDLYGHGESVEAEFSFRASGGKSIKDGSAYVKEVHGNSVVWNQLSGHGATSLPQESWEGNRVTINGTFELETPQYDTKARGAELSLPNGGNKCLAIIRKISGKVLSGEVKTSSTSLMVGGSLVLSADSTESYTMIFNTFKEGSTYHFNRRYLAGTVCENLVLEYQFIDLTKAFPNDWKNINTIEDFYKLQPTNIDINEYNAGEVIPFTADGIKSVGDNAWDEQWEVGNISVENGGNIATSLRIRTKDYIQVIGGESYVITMGNASRYSDVGTICYYDNDKRFISATYPAVLVPFTIPANAKYIRISFISTYGTTYKNDITISLYHSGWKAEVDNTYKPYWDDTLMLDARIKEAFPNGMYRAGSAYDEIRFNKETNKWEAVKRIGSVDLGNYKFYKDSSRGFWKVIISDMGAKPNWICSKYDNIINAQLGAIRGIFFNILEDGRCVICITDTSYGDDYQKFNNDIQGVMLYYELAEPIVIPLGEFEMDYKVADFGTEEIIGSEPSAPFNGRTIYQFNAVDQIRENYNEIEKIKAALAKAGITI